MWEETEVLGENPRVRVGDRHTLSHTTSADHGDSVVRSESATSTLPGHHLHTINKLAFIQCNIVLKYQNVQT